MATILVTGVYGFVGSTLIKRLLDTTKHKIIGFGRNTNQHNKKRIEQVAGQISIIEGDLTDDVTELCEGVDYVIHTAAKTFVDHSIRSPLPFIQSNLLGTFNLLESARQNNVKRFIQVSTDEVYGSILEGTHTELSPLSPSNPYAAMKAAADCLVQSYVKTYGLDAVITRTENNCGPFQHKQKVFPVFVGKALNNQSLPIYGDGGHRRMWIHVNDHCDALIHLLDHGEKGNIYNVAGAQELTNLELANMILQILDKPQSLITFIPDDKIRPGHDRRYSIDSTKLRKTGWVPKYTLANTVESTVKWYVHNGWWWV